jgi:hypothetical protein
VTAPLTLSPEAIGWLVDGSHGRSSRTIFDHLVLGRESPGHDIPYDPDDFQRCERLLRAVPGLRERLPELAACDVVFTFRGVARSRGAAWAELAARWSEIAAVIDAECPGLLDGGWAKSRCSGLLRGYDLMVSIYEPVLYGERAK